MGGGGLRPSQVYHVAVMMCYDKKLEASREDFFNDVYRTRDVDCVITTGTRRWRRERTHRRTQNRARIIRGRMGERGRARTPGELEVLLTEQGVLLATAPEAPLLDAPYARRVLAWGRRPCIPYNGWA